MRRGRNEKWDEERKQGGMKDEKRKGKMKDQKEGINRGIKE